MVVAVVVMVVVVVVVVAVAELVQPARLRERAHVPLRPRAVRVHRLVEERLRVHHAPDGGIGDGGQASEGHGSLFSAASKR